MIDVPTLLVIWLCACIPLGLAVGKVVADTRAARSVDRYGDVQAALRDLCDAIEVPPAYVVLTGELFDQDDAA